MEPKNEIIIPKRLKLAFVANTTWFISNFKVSLLRYFEEAGFDVYVIAPPDEYLHYLHLLKNTRHIPLRFLSRKGMNPLQELRLLNEFYRIYNKLQPDIVIHNTIKPNIYGSIAARMVNIPAITVIPGLGHVFIDGGLRRFVVERLYKFVQRFNAKIVFENSDDLSMFIRRNIIPPEKGYAFKGIGVDTTVFKPMLKIRADKKTIFAFMGRLIYEKGVAEFVDAASQLSIQYGTDVECWLIGSIDNYNPSAVEITDLLRWIEAKSIVYYGHIGDVKEIIREVDCIVLPSYYPEGGPKVLQEGMAMGKPIITTDMPGCREAVEEGENGFLVKPRDIDSLVDAMKKIVNMTEEQRSQMGEKGRQKAISELDYSISNPIYLDIVRKAIKN